MDWQNERYVRSYTRDTVTRKVWTWEARAIWDALMRKLDRAGVMDIGENEPAEAVAAMVDIPLAVVSAHLPSILKSKAVVVVGPCLVVPNFVEAQEANQSDKQRQAESRARRKDKAMRGDLLPDVTERDEKSHAVTARHTESHDVTPSLAELSQAEPSQVVIVSPSAPTTAHRDDVRQVWDRLNNLRKSLMPKARGLKLNAKHAGAVAKRIDESEGGAQDALDVLESLAARCRRNPRQLEWFQGSTIFRPDNYHRELGKLGSEDGASVTVTGLEDFDPVAARAAMDRLTGEMK